MKAVIMAAGVSSRWKNHLGVPKQLIKIDGEPILYRTIRLAKDNKIDEIYVTVPEKGAFGDLGVTEIVGSSDCEIDKFLNAKEHAGAIFFWGDTYFSGRAMHTICRDHKDVQFYGRRKGSNLTGKKWGELFAVKTNSYFMRAAEELRKQKDKMERCASWELYMYVTTGVVVKDRNIPMNISKQFTVIDDWTEDFDTPEDYEAWISNYCNQPNNICQVPYWAQKEGL